MVRMFFYINTIMKTDILNSILGVVSEVCEVSREDILSHCKREEVVDARCIFVHYCKEYGFQSKVVAEFLNRKRACVVDAYARNYRSYSKVSFMFRTYSRQVADKLSVMFPVTE